MKIAGIEQAITILRRGGLVAFPTETVYGLGADAENPDAVTRIFAAKGRPVHHPVIVHIGHHDLLHRLAVDVPPSALLLTQHFWPGPLTLILKRNTHVPDAVTGGQDTVGLRMPDHPVARALLTAFGGGIAAPSANRFGRLSPTTAAHVREELGDAVDYVLDGGPCQVGIESTVLDLSGVHARLLRPGAVTAAQIEAILGKPLAAVSGDVPRSPGMMASHYAPQTALTLAASNDLLARIKQCLENGERVAVLAWSAVPALPGCIRQAMPDDAGAYAHELYARLRELDALQVDRILVEAPPPDAAWLAVSDRLMRAASQVDRGSS